MPSAVEASWWFYCINGSVFSEAFLVGWKLVCQPSMDFSGIARSVFLDLIAINPSCCRFIKVAKFCEFDRRENEAANLFVASIMVLIDRAWRELSNGCHIVFWSNLDHMVKSGGGCHFQGRWRLSSLLFNRYDLSKVGQYGWLYAQSIELLKGFPKRHSSTSLAT